MIIDIPLMTIMNLAVSVSALLGIILIYTYIKANIKRIAMMVSGMLTTNDVKEMIDRTLAEKEGNKAFQKHVEKHYGGKK